MRQNLETEGGTIKVSSEVIGTIATLAASEVDGVIRMGGSVVEGIIEIFKKNYEKGVKVEFHNSDVNVELSIIVAYGVKIPEVAVLVQQNVKRAIENMVGLNVIKINITIQGVEIEKKKENKETTFSLEKF